jgi:beta-galactosidase
MNMKNYKYSIRQSVTFLILSMLTFLLAACSTNDLHTVRSIELFTKDWRFNLGDVPDGQEPGLDDSGWRLLDLPHDWSIEGEFSPEHPAGVGGGALPGGIGWYRKTFSVPESESGKLQFIEFDGVYMNSEVWINGEYLGKRPNGYISFRYELTPYLLYGEDENVLAVRVDNSLQPNSRWYSGSGIYRNVRLVKTGTIYVDHWGTYVTTPDVTEIAAVIHTETKIRNVNPPDSIYAVVLRTSILDENGKKIAETSTEHQSKGDSSEQINQELVVENPVRWSLDNPYLYRVITTIEQNGVILDTYVTPFGIRTFYFDREEGFYLNGERIKIKGVCNHHDLGFLGAAVNRRALERQLEIMKDMGVNAIRTAHNPPAPELLDLTDRMGFIVMNEAFDVWAKKKTEYDYAMYWNDWYRRDMEDFVLRDRNHPSVFIWSIGNELIEQWDRDDESGTSIARELTTIVKELDNTRPVTAGLNDPNPENPIIRSGSLDLIGYNYKHEQFADFPEIFPGEIFIATETTSALATRGSYDMPSDSIRRWPYRWDLPFHDGNPDQSVSSYDNVSAPWGSTHMETWRIVKKHDFLSGMFIWTGFDYLGEPTPYEWPSRSSYFGIVDLAGFPKDAFYMYKSEWTEEPVLHIFPHWNWEKGQTIDVWAYTNYDEVELFLNGESLGVKSKNGEDLHLMWRLTYEPGTLRAVGRAEGRADIVKEIRTAGLPARIILEADRTTIAADGTDLSFITVSIVDENGTLVPHADNLVRFSVKGEGSIAGVDNGSQTSHEPFIADFRKAYNGMCLVVVQSTERPGRISLQAESEDLDGASVNIISRRK